MKWYNGWSSVKLLINKTPPLLQVRFFSALQPYVGSPPMSDAEIQCAGLEQPGESEADSGGHRAGGQAVQGCG